MTAAAPMSSFRLIPGCRAEVSQASYTGRELRPRASSATFQLETLLAGVPQPEDVSLISAA